MINNPVVSATGGGRTRNCYNTWPTKDFANAVVGVFAWRQRGLCGCIEEFNQYNPC